MRERALGIIYVAAAAIPITTTLLSAVLFLRWGFGGGRGPADRWIFVLQYPAMLLVDRIPERLTSALPEWVTLFLLPLLVNLAIFLLCAAIIHACCLGWAVQEGPNGQSKS